MSGHVEQDADSVRAVQVSDSRKETSTWLTCDNFCVGDLVR